MRRLAVALVVAVLVTGACSLPNDDEPRLIAESDVARLTPSTVNTPDEGNRLVTVFYFNTNRNTGQLTAFERRVEDVTPQSRLEALFELPSVDRGDPGYLQSRIPAGTIVNAVRVDELGTLSIDLGTTDGTAVLPLEAQVQIQALAQIVYTVDLDSDVDTVTFLFNGVQQQVPVETEPGTKAVVTVDDYPSFEPLTG